MRFACRTAHPAPRRVLRTLAALLALAGAPRAAAAQDAAEPAGRPPRAFGLVLGTSQYDLRGVGGTLLIGARYEVERGPWLVTELAFGRIDAAADFGDRQKLTTIEGQLQAQLVFGPLRPYVGAGLGIASLTDRAGGSLTVSGAGGARLAIPRTRLDLRGELRLRGIERRFTGSAVEITGGVAYRF